MLSKIALHLALLQHYTFSKLPTFTYIMSDRSGAPDEAKHCLTLYSMSYAPMFIHMFMFYCTAYHMHQIIVSMHSLTVLSQRDYCNGRNDATH